MTVYRIRAGSRRARWSRHVALAGVAVGLAAGSGSYAPVHAAETRPTAMVSLGDSFISGEAGRWQGNAALTVPFGDVDGTDRTAFGCNASYTWCGRDPARVYGPSYFNGCDRSDVAEIRSAQVAVDERVNLACSGAVTTNVLRAVDGGVPFKGEPPQADQLADVAARDDVQLVVLSIGGNDLGFSNILTACAKHFLTPGGTPCKPSQDPVLQAGLAALGPKVRAALASVRAAMASAGYHDSDYRLVLQSYPSPLPTGEQYRYDESYTRYAEGGCPFFNSDSTWAHDTVVPAIAATLHDAAQAQHADFLDLQAAFDGHEVCSEEDHQASRQNNLAEPVSPSTGEWIRFVTLLLQGTPQESLHPNAYGQQALGDCLGKLWATGPGSFRCVNTAEHDPQQMLLYRLL